MTNKMLIKTMVMMIITHQDNYDYDTQSNGAGRNNDDDDNGPSLAK